MTSSATLKERKAAILKFSVPAIITFCEMIMRGYDAILNHRVHISIITGTMISNKYIENSVFCSKHWYPLDPQFGSYSLGDHFTPF